MAGATADGLAAHRVCMHGPDGVRRATAESTRRERYVPACREKPRSLGGTNKPALKTNSALALARSSYDSIALWHTAAQDRDLWRRLAEASLQ